MNTGYNPQQKKHNQDYYKDQNTGKNDFFANLNNLLIKSGLLAKGVQAASSFVANRVGEAQKNARKALLMRILVVVGGLLVVYGIVNIFTMYYSLQEWTNLIVGAIFIAGAGILYLTR